MKRENSLLKIDAAYTICPIFRDLLVPKETQGGNANISGKELEDRVKRAFANKGVECITNYNYPVTYVSKTVLFPQYQFTHYYSGIGFSDFLLAIHNGPFIRIECKQQNVAGTADNKLASVFLDIIKGYKEEYVIIVLEGSGFNDDIVRWFKEECDLYSKKSGKKIKIFDFLELSVWIDTELVKLICEAK